MIRRLVAAWILAAVFSISTVGGIVAINPTPAAAAVSQIAMFGSEAAAQGHCPKDIVVWLNIPSGIYHEKGMRWYGRTKHGAYVCRKEAVAAGFRDTGNGQ